MQESHEEYVSMMKPFLSGHLGIRGAHIIRYVDMLYTLVVTLFGGPYSSEQVGVIIANISHHQMDLDKQLNP